MKVELGGAEADVLFSALPPFADDPACVAVEIDMGEGFVIHGVLGLDDVRALLSQIAQVIVAAEGMRVGDAGGRCEPAKGGAL